MKQHKPWEIKASSDIFKNNKVQFIMDEAVHESDTSRVRHKTRIILKPGVVILPIDSDGNLYLGREFRYAIQEWVIQAATGEIDSEEDPIISAKRELEEELGITAGKWQSMNYVSPLPGTIICPQYLFIAEDLVFTKQSNEDFGNIEVLKLPFEEAIAMVMDGKIVEPQTALLILKAAKYLNKL